MKHEELLTILGNIKILDRLFVTTPTNRGWHLQVTYNEADVDTGMIEQQYSRKWFVADDATESDVVDTAFAAVMRSYDHVVQEHFLYKGKRIFSPHFSVEQRLTMAAQHQPPTQQASVENAIAGFEHWLRQDMYAQADELLMLYKIDRCDPATLLGILSITYHAKDRLKNRGDFLRRAEVKLRAELGDERTDDLLRSRR